jgi:hypothetical protein
VKKLGIFALVTALFISITAADLTAAGGLVLNGTGVRTKSILGTMYYLSLYVPQELKGKSGKEIIEANAPMNLVLKLDSKLITRERFLEAISEGFGKSAAAGYTSPKKTAFQAQFDKTVFAKGDFVIMSYTPAGGLVTSYKKLVEKDGKKEYTAQVLGTIAGLDLKKALFAIWLGPKPIQDSLKASLLGGK